MPLFTTLLAMPDQFERLLAWVPTRPSGLGTRQLGRDPLRAFQCQGHLCHLLDIEVLGYQVRFSSHPGGEACRSSASLDGYQLALDH